MLGLGRQSQLDKVKAAVRDAFEYVDEIAGDERLRADLRAAVGHGREARGRIRSDVTADSIASRLANDRKLRKKVRAMLDDLDSASDRIRRKRGHRLRNGLLVLGSLGAITAVVPRLRRWISGRMSARPHAVDVGTT